MTPKSGQTAEFRALVDRVAQLEKEKVELLAALKDIAESIAEEVDVIDGNDGPRPNWAMRLMNEHGERIATAIKNAEVA